MSSSRVLSVEYESTTKILEVRDRADLIHRRIWSDSFLHKTITHNESIMVGRERHHPLTKFVQKIRNPLIEVIRGVFLNHKREIYFRQEES